MGTGPYGSRIIYDPLHPYMVLVSISKMFNVKRTFIFFKRLHCKRDFVKFVLKFIWFFFFLSASNHLEYIEEFYLYWSPPPLSLFSRCRMECLALTEQHKPGSCSSRPCPLSHQCHLLAPPSLLYVLKCLSFSPLRYKLHLLFQIPLCLHLWQNLFTYLSAILPN